MAEGGQPSSNLYISDLPVGFDESSVKQLFSQYGTVESVRVLPAKYPDSPTHALVKFQNLHEAQWLCENLNQNIPEGLELPVGVKFASHPGQGGDGSRTAAFQAAAASGKGKGEGKAFGGKGGGKIMPEMINKPWEGGVPNHTRSQPYGKGDGWDGDGMGKGGKGNGVVEQLYQALGASGAFPIPQYQHGTYVQNLPVDTQDCDLLRLFSPFGAIPPNGIKSMRAEDGSCKGMAFVNFAEAFEAHAACNALNGALLPSGQTLVVKMKQGASAGVINPNMDDVAKAKGKGNFKTQMCSLWQAGNCSRSNCSFAHGEDDLQPFSTPLGGTTGGFAQRQNAKTKLCTLFAAGNCHRPACSFAHGEHELQPFPDGNWANQRISINGQ